MVQIVRFVGANKAACRQRDQLIYEEAVRIFINKRQGIFPPKQINPAICIQALNVAKLVYNGGISHFGIIRGLKMDLLASKNIAQRLMQLQSSINRCTHLLGSIATVDTGPPHSKSSILPPCR